MKVLIAVPTFESISPDTFKAIYGLDCGEHQTWFDFVRGYDCARARNAIASLALEQGVDYVLMVDSDVVPPEEALLNLMEGCEGVCLGYYANRHRDETALYRLKGGTAYVPYKASEIEELRNSGNTKVEVRGGGLGCALVKASVFEEVSAPWFEWLYSKDGTERSEDLAFCEKCRSEGVRIMADTRVGCGHLRRYVEGVV